MAVRPAEQRTADIKSLRERVDRYEMQLRDMPRVSRLAANEDFKWYVATWQKVAEDRKKAQETAVGVFKHVPCSSDDLMKLKQSFMAAEAYVGALDDFMTGPAKETQRLRKLQDEEIPKLKDQIRKIEGGR